ncbi:MAG TPA: hypothetical protein G4O08_07230 [Anaerolineae bacterium]|nr:hypothetical protein [Anaerolineae bacterium]
MQEAFVITLFSIIGTVILGSLFIAILILFPRLIRRTGAAAKGMHGRSLILGVVNLAFFVILSIALSSIGERVASTVLQVLALILFSVLLVGVGLGLAGMALIMGEQLAPDRSEVQQIAAGSVLLILSSLTPFLGWFLLLPYLCFRGVGGLVLGIFRRKALDEVQDPDMDE